MGAALPDKSNIQLFNADDAPFDLGDILAAGKDLHVVACDDETWTDLVADDDFKIVGVELSLVSDQTGKQIIVAATTCPEIAVPKVGPPKGEALNVFSDAVQGQLNWLSYQSATLRTKFSNALALTQEIPALSAKVDQLCTDVAALMAPKNPGLPAIIQNIPFKESIYIPPEIDPCVEYLQPQLPVTLVSYVGEPEFRPYAAYLPPKLSVHVNYQRPILYEFCKSENSWGRDEIIVLAGYPKIEVEALQ